MVQNISLTSCANSFWWQWIKSFTFILPTASSHEVMVGGSHLELSQVPHFENSVVAARQEERFAPVPANHVDVRWVCLLCREHRVGWGADVPDANGLIHWTRRKDLGANERTHNNIIWTTDQNLPKDHLSPTQFSAVCAVLFWWNTPSLEWLDFFPFNSSGAHSWAKCNESTPPPAKLMITPGRRNYIRPANWFGDILSKSIETMWAETLFLETDST